MRRFSLWSSLLAVLVLAGLAATPTAFAAAAIPEQQLREALASQMAQAPATSGAFVVDAGNGRVLFDDRSRIRRTTASVMKLYNTSTALLRMGTGARIATRVRGTGRRRMSTWHGNLYLRGDGDFMFGSQSFARRAYGGGGGTVEALARSLRGAGITRVAGSVFGDASAFTDDRGPNFTFVLCSNPLFGPGCPYGPAGRFERPMPNGPRTPIAFNRSLIGERGVRIQRDPVRFSAQQLVAELRRRGITVEGAVGVRRTPAGARTLATTRSQTIAELIKRINKPSDNYAADILFRVLGARFAGAGSRVGGARVVSAEMRRAFRLRPRVWSGSGENLRDLASPRDVVALLRGMRARREGTALRRSLSLAGRDGTLRRLRGTVAENRCELKDGTRVDEVPNTTLNVAGYCRTLSGRTLVFAIMMNGMPIEVVPPYGLSSPAYALEDAMVRALAGYSG